MFIKLIIILFLLIIFYCLGSGLYYLIADTDTNRLAKALTWRICLSLGLFILVLIAYALGWIHPHAL